MQNEELKNLKESIENLIKKAFKDVDKFYYKGNEKAGIRTRKTLVKLSKVFKSLRKDMLLMSSIRKSQKKELKTSTKK